MRKNFGKYDETNIKSNKKYNLEGLPASGILRVATPGDYRPMACWEPRLQAYRGFDIELARSLAAALGLGVTFCRTSWQRLETEARHAAFDLAVGGISRTQERVATLTVSAGYLATGKTILCRRGEEARFSDLAASTGRMSASSAIRAARMKHLCAASCRRLTSACFPRMRQSPERLRLAVGMSCSRRRWKLLITSAGIRGSWHRSSSGRSAVANSASCSGGILLLLQGRSTGSWLRSGSRECCSA